MTAARTPHPVKVTDSNATAGTVLIVYNRTTGDKETTKFNASGTTVYDLANLGAYTAGDVIEFSVHGKNEGSNTYTISGGKGEVTITTAASAAPSITI